MWEEGRRGQERQRVDGGKIASRGGRGVVRPKILVHLREYLAHILGVNEAQQAGAAREDVGEGTSTVEEIEECLREFHIRLEVVMRFRFSHARKAGKEMKGSDCNFGQRFEIGTMIYLEDGCVAVRERGGAPK